MRKTSLYRQPLGNPMPIAELITPNQARLLPQSTLSPRNIHNITFSLNIVSETPDTVNADRYFRFSLIDFLNLHRETFSLHCRAGCRRRTHLARQPHCRRRCSSRPQPVRSHRVRRQGQKGRVTPVDPHQMHVDLPTCRAPVTRTAPLLRTARRISRSTALSMYIRPPLADFDSDSKFANTRIIAHHEERNKRAAALAI